MKTWSQLQQNPGHPNDAIHPPLNLSVSTPVCLCLSVISVDLLAV